jgi:hypothetical protein
MRKLTTTLCLTIALLLGSMGWVVEALMLKVLRNLFLLFQKITKDGSRNPAQEVWARLSGQTV